MNVRTRMAPSPTGEYHIGGMRTLLYNYAFAKKMGGQFILRIEDTDRERLVEGACERLIQVIKDYGLDWDEGPGVEGPYSPYIQSQRLEVYAEHAKKLVDSGHAYYCFCTKERLDQLREDQKSKGLSSTRYDKKCLGLSKEEVNQKLSSGSPFVIRLNVKPGELVTFEDKILGSISFPTSDIDDQVLLKSDGFPTYHLAVVVDDYLMKISHVMRGGEWLPSTPKHILLYKAFGWELPIYAHLPLLKEIGDTKKLSKRMGSVAATEFLAEGYLPEALLNFLMLLGWNPGTEKEIFTLSEFIEEFSLERMHKTDLVAFDRDKLLWLNGHYINHLLDSKELLQRLTSWSLKFNVELVHKGAPEEKVLRALPLIKDRIKKLTEYNDLAQVFFESEAPKVEKTELGKFAGSYEKAIAIITDFIKVLEDLDVWETSKIDEVSHDFLTKHGLKPKEVFMTVRLAVTGREVTPPLFPVLELLGKSTVLLRLNKYLAP